MQIAPETAFLLGLLVFWGITFVVSQVLHLDKHGFRILLFFLSYKSEKIKNGIKKIGERRELLWKTLSNLGLAVAFGLAIYVTYFLSSNLLKFFSPVVESVPIVPVVPAITIRLDSLPYFFAAVAVIVVLHELAHGIIAVSEKVSVKSAGVALMFTFFGGFVEPDEKDFERASKASKLRILGAGSAANFATGLLVIVLLGGLFAPPIGVLVNSTVERGPLDVAGVKRFDIIDRVNGTEIGNLSILAKYLGDVTPGALLNLRINGENRSVRTENKSGRAVIGLASGQDYYPCRLSIDRVVAVNLYLLLDWAFLASFSVAVFNMLPAYPFDGEKFVYYSLENYVKKEKRLTLRILINIIFLGVLLANMMLSFIWFGLPRI